MDAVAVAVADRPHCRNTSLSFGLQTTTTAAAGGRGPGNTNARSNYAYDASSASPALPPPQAYMPSLKILKRPTSAAANKASSATASSAAAAQAKSLKDREKAYQEARRKIFGESEMAAINAPLPASPALSPGQSPDVSEGEQQQQQQQQVVPAKQGRDGNRAGKKGVGNSRGDSRQRKGALPPPASAASASAAGSLSVPGGSSASATPPVSVSPRPSTPLALASVAGGPSLIREPLNPPSANTQTGHVPRGFTHTRKPPKVQKNLSPAAQAFVPRGLVPAKVADKQIQTRQPGEGQPSQPKTLQEGMSRLAV